MIDLILLTATLTYTISHRTGGIEIKFSDNDELINFYNLTKLYNSFYISLSGQEDVYLYTNVKFDKSINTNTNTNTVFYKCDVKKFTKRQFILYLRKEKIKDIWSDINNDNV